MVKLLIHRDETHFWTKTSLFSGDPDPNYPPGPTHSGRLHGASRRVDSLQRQRGRGGRSHVAASQPATEERAIATRSPEVQWRFSPEYVGCQVTAAGSTKTRRAFNRAVNKTMSEQVNDWGFEKKTHTYVNNNKSAQFFAISLKLKLRWLTITF